MKYEVEVQTTRSDRRTVEAETLEDALKMAQDGEGESMNEGQISVTAHGRPYRESCCGPDTAQLATGIRDTTVMTSTPSAAEG